MKNLSIATVVFFCFFITKASANELAHPIYLAQGLQDKNVVSKIESYRDHHIIPQRIVSSWYQAYDGRIRFKVEFTMDYTAPAGYPFHVKGDCALVVAVPLSVDGAPAGVKIESNDCQKPICPQEYIHTDSEGWYDAISGMNINYSTCQQDKDQAICQKPDDIRPKGWYSKITGDLLSVDADCGL